MSSDVFSGIGSLVGTALGGPLGNSVAQFMGARVRQLFNSALDGMFQSLGLPQSAQDAVSEGFKGGFNFNFNIGGR